MPERALLIGLEIKGRPGKKTGAAADQLDYTETESLEELAVLTSSAGAEIVDRVLQSRDRAEAATLIGAGKVEELAAWAKGSDIDVVIFDRDLSPTQQRNLEDAFERKVIDRTQLILDIFASRARTREGQLQVELAQLNYLLPRLTGRGTQMSRLGGGIGTRGPGETQLETDRRRIAKRIKKIGDDLEAVRAGRSVQRRQRQAVPLATAALVGYTNAGKSTLFNRLTGSEVLADARMFATLDPTVRSVTLPSRRRILLSDTVGFIRNLPVTLVKAFRATLEETIEAALILHVVDLSSEHAEHQIAHVLKVLADIGAGETRQLLVLNKVDRIPGGAADVESVRSRLVGHDSPALQAPAVAVSARTGHGLAQLLEAIDRELPFDPVSTAVFRFAQSDGAKVSFIHEFGRVRATHYDGEFCEIEADVSESVKKRLSDYLK